MKRVVLLSQQHRDMPPSTVQAAAFGAIAVPNPQ